MTKLFSGVEHFFAWVVSKLLPTAAKDITTVESVLGSDAATTLAGLAGTAGQDALKYLQAIGGSLVAGVNAAVQAGATVEAAVSQFGLNGALDAAALAALKVLYETVQSALGGKTVTVPTAIAVPAKS